MRADRFRVALASLLVLAAAYGCAGMAQQRQGGGTTQSPTQTTRSGVSGAADARRQGNSGGTIWSGMGFGARATTDLGRQISDAVASMFGGGNGGTVLGGRANTSGVGGDGAMPGGNADSFRTGTGGAMLDGDDKASNALRDRGSMPGGNVANPRARTGGAMLGGNTQTRPAMRVSTLVVGDIAYIGIDAAVVQGTQQDGGRAATDTNPGSNTGAGNATAGTPLEEQVRSRVRAMFPQLSAVYVTTDPTLVYRIARVTGDQPELSPQEKANEVTTIVREMTPATGAAPAS